MVIDHAFYLSLALKEAWKYQGLTYPNPPVGALILDENGKILAIEAHHQAGESHAELLAIEKALKHLGKDALEKLSSPNEKHAYILKHYSNSFKGCTIYVTLEPCNHQGATPSCAILIEAMGFETVVCGVKDPNHKATGGIERLQHAGIHVISGILEDACKELIAPFMKWKQHKPFVFFKLALSANGVYDGGTITSLQSRTFVHQMRNKIDLLVIGGETVRRDRPTLDSRLCGGKAPDILILSHHQEFDKDIPLFQVPNREVFIASNLDKIADYHSIMIEGAEAMMEVASPWIDWYCIFTSSFYKKGSTIQLEKSFQRLHTRTYGSDIITWYKKGES
jgi:diaminohydroxyphosphoribosylaminopyrimidine deaminase/5-amino-6-(5-phosphoribosylamino)uracil reductase